MAKQSLVRKGLAVVKAAHKSGTADEKKLAFQIISLRARTILVRGLEETLKINPINCCADSLARDARHILRKIGGKGSLPTSTERMLLMGNVWGRLSKLNSLALKRLQALRKIKAVRARKQRERNREKGERNRKKPR